MKSDPKQRIIDSTIQLIEEKSSGEPSIREISTDAGISLGLINYYFGSRENLIKEAVRFHVNKNVISTYSPGLKSSQKTLDPEQRLEIVVVGILNYLADHPNLARVSIINDLCYPQDDDNSHQTWMGLKGAIEYIYNREISHEEKLSIWTIIGSIHEAFLRPDEFFSLMGYSLKDEKTRKLYAKYLAHVLVKK